MIAAAVRLEVVAVRDVDRARRPLVRVEYQHAVGVGDQQRAHVFGIDRTVEQQPLAQRRRLRQQCGIVHGFHHAPDRQFVDLQVARDAAFQRQRQVGRGLAGIVQCIPAHLHQGERTKGRDHADQDKAGGHD